jgi:uncharacterized protein YabE (DUF348 family)
MKRWLIPVFLLGLAALLFLLYSQGIQKTVTLKINNEAREIITSSWTVSAFLEEQGILLTEADSINPQITSLLIGDKEISIQHASWFTVNYEGSTQSIFGRYESLEELLSDLQIEAAPEDSLFLDGILVSSETRLLPGTNHSLQIIKPKSIVLTQGSSSEQFLTTYPTLGESLWFQNIYLEAGDNLDPPLDNPTHGSTKAELEKSQEITIQLSNEVIKSKTGASTVGEALSDSGIALQGLDYSRPEENAPLPENGHIQVIRVREEQYLESETIPFNSETQPAADLEIDNRSLVQSGVLGLMTKRIRVRYEDDIEISRQVEDEYISQEPQAEIIGYGTKVVPRTLDTPGGQITYWRALEMYAVSYNVTSNGGYGTATGVPLAKGIAAIDPQYIAYGTQMYVPGYGNALAADTGGGINGRMIDLGYLDEDYVSWHQWVTVYFLWPPPENIAWIIP